MSKEVKEIAVDDQSAAELEKTIAATQAEVAKEEPAVIEKKEEPKPEEFQYEAGDGTIYKATSEKELFEKVTKALNHTKLALKDREGQIHDLKQQAPAPEKKEAVAAVYDHKKYLELVETDSLKAYEYQKEHDPEIQALRKERAEESAGQKVKDEVMRFYRDAPDYAKVETPELNNLMKKRLKEKGRGFTAEAMGLTYYELREEGKIPKPAAGEPVKERKAMPESATGGGNDTPTDEPNFDNMSSKELVTYMKKNKVPGAEYLH